MARIAVLYNIDGGRLVDVTNGNTGVGVRFNAYRQARRYGNLNDFTDIMPTATWNDNEWGDGSKTLNDNLRGYRIVEGIYKSPKETAVADNTSALSPATPNPAANIISRQYIMYSYDFGAYLWIDPTTTGLPAAEQRFAYVNDPMQATRINNLIPILNLLQNSILGDGKHGWGVEQYVFTKAQAPRNQGQTFTGAPSGSRDILRAFVPYSKTLGRYIYITPETISGPPADIVYEFTNNPWAGSRFPSSATFDAIVTGNAALADHDWELPNFYFNRAAQTIPTDPFTDFWSSNAPTLNPNYPTGTSIAITALSYLQHIAPFYPGTGRRQQDNRKFQEYWAEVTPIVTAASGYPSPVEFERFWNGVSQSQYDTWLRDLWDIYNSVRP